MVSCGIGYSGRHILNGAIGAIEIRICRMSYLGFIFAAFK